jgi:hypothetical protein
MLFRNVVAGGAAALALLAIACGSSNHDQGGGNGGDDASGGSNDTCPSCTTDSDCGGSRCVHLAGALYCAPACNSGNTCSTAGDTCVGVTASDGSQAQVCVPPGDCAPSASSSSGGTSSGGTSSGGTASSSGGTGSSGGTSSSGSQPVGTVGNDGGSLSSLLFAVVGDTRPPNEDEISSYPTAIITKIFADVQAHSPAIPFVVSTGDYQFSSTGSSSTASQQLSLYVQARAQYSGVQYVAMGNHECTGADASNCPSGSKPTANLTAFQSQLLAPIGKTLPYYVININATDGSWTSKFVFIAANAWDSTQSSWLSSTMAQKTTYTFVVRHEPTESSGNAPGVAPSDTIIAGFPYTALITGHSHTWDSFGYNTPKEVLVGNGGAPLSNSSKDYGYALFSQRSDGAIVMDMIDYQSGAAQSAFHKVVTADGTVTQ